MSLARSYSSAKVEVICSPSRKAPLDSFGSDRGGGGWAGSDDGHGDGGGGEDGDGDADTGGDEGGDAALLVMMRMPVTVEVMARTPSAMVRAATVWGPLPPRV